MKRKNHANIADASPAVIKASLYILIVIYYTSRVRVDVYYAGIDEMRVCNMVGPHRLFQF